MNGIKCIKCVTKLAEVTCLCKELPLCKKHFGEHVINEGHHPYKTIYFKLRASQKSETYQSCITKITMIKLLKHKIQVDTCKIIKEIDLLKNSAFQVLNQSLEKIQTVLNNLSKRKLTKPEYNDCKEMIGTKWGVCLYKEITLGIEYKNYYNRKFYIEHGPEKIQNFNYRLKAETTRAYDKKFCLDKSFCLDKTFCFDRNENIIFRPSMTEYNEAQRLVKNPKTKKMKKNISEKKLSIHNIIIPKPVKKFRD